jgi:hypothetical protein
MSFCFRDGLVYFLVVFATNLINVLIFLVSFNISPTMFLALIMS